MTFIHNQHSFLVFKNITYLIRKSDTCFKELSINNEDNIESIHYIEIVSKKILFYNFYIKTWLKNWYILKIIQFRIYKF